MSATFSEMNQNIKMSDEWMDKQMDEWMNGWMSRWMDGWIDGWMSGWMDMWLNIQKKQKLDGSELEMNGWMDG